MRMMMWNFAELQSLHNACTYIHFESLFTYVRTMMWNKVGCGCGQSKNCEGEGNVKTATTPVTRESFPISFLSHFYKVKSCLIFWYLTSIEIWIPPQWPQHRQEAKLPFYFYYCINTYIVQFFLAERLFAVSLPPTRCDTSKEIRRGTDNPNASFWRFTPHWHWNWVLFSSEIWNVRDACGAFTPPFSTRSWIRAHNQTSFEF